MNCANCGLNIKQNSADKTNLRWRYPGYNKPLILTDSDGVYLAIINFNSRRTVKPKFSVFFAHHSGVKEKGSHRYFSTNSEALDYINKQFIHVPELEESSLYWWNKTLKDALRWTS